MRPKAVSLERLPIETARHMSYFIAPSEHDIFRALESWNWLPVEGKQPILVTAFADVFFCSGDEIWFLDTLEGNLKNICSSRAQLDSILSTTEGQDHYLLSPFVDRAARDGLSLTDTQCYDFKLHPRVGGAVDFANIERRDFVVALHIKGQLHEQVRHMAPGTKISKFTILDEKSSKPWWKIG
jgi:hypothetical protein